MRNPFALFLFSTDAEFIQIAVEGGVAGIVVDWEHIGKAQRQAGFDTQISQDTLEHLRRVRRCTEALVVCRINPFGPWSRREVEEAIDGGADKVLIPMVCSPEEVEQVLTWVRERCGVGILIETLEAVHKCHDMARLPLTRVYLGLQNLAIARGTPNPFRAIVDGTVERVPRAFDVPFGFAGLTLPEAGSPIPCRLLIAEMASLDCSFSFLRRSFLRDILGRDPRWEIPRLLDAIHEAFRHPPAVQEAMHRELLTAIEAAEPYFASRNVPLARGHL